MLSDDSGILGASKALRKLEPEDMCIVPECGRRADPKYPGPLPHGFYCTKDGKAARRWAGAGMAGRLEEFTTGERAVSQIKEADM